MMHLIVEVPDELARSLERIAATQSISVQQLALDRLRSLVPITMENPRGSAAALLQVMREPPIPETADVDALDAAIAAGRLPVRAVDLF